MAGVPAVLEADRVSLRFGGVRALTEVSFAIERGEIFSIIGPNGAGKTTTLQILLNLVRPSSGSATFDGSTYSQIPRPMHEVGAHLSSDAFHPGRTAGDHLRVMAAGSGLSVARIPALLELVGLSTDADRRVGGYSLGMRQRLGLATALLGDIFRKFIIIDINLDI